MLTFFTLVPPPQKSGRTYSSEYSTLTDVTRGTSLTSFPSSGNTQGQRPLVAPTLKITWLNPKSIFCHSDTKTQIKSLTRLQVARNKKLTEATRKWRFCLTATQDLRSFMQLERTLRWELWKQRWRPRLFRFCSECRKKKSAFADWWGTLLKLAYPQWFLSSSNANAIFFEHVEGRLREECDCQVDETQQHLFSGWIPPAWLCSGGSAQITVLFRVAAASVRQEADATMLCNKVLVVRSLWLLKAHPLQPTHQPSHFKSGTLCASRSSFFSAVCYCKASKKKKGEERHDLAGPSLHPDITGAKKKKNRGLTCGSEEVESSPDIWADKHVSSMWSSEVRKTVSEGISEVFSVKQRVHNVTSASSETYF